ncbi:unnamed protein product [Schistosoma mattheei]|uniref:Uncharacterized protein n=2 Tax=Schistosoma TaxID=6181 RepID=A0A3P8DFF2_9TREM|nr:unnamed protein product [Schistosoma mattheei]
MMNALRLVQSQWINYAHPLMTDLSELASIDVVEVGLNIIVIFLVMDLSI